MSAWLTSWRLALRLARRDLLKHRARAVIALVMVTLPVFAVVTADVLIQTAQVSPAEGIDRRLGTVATAKVEVSDAGQKVIQGADPEHGFGTQDGTLAHPATLAGIERVIGRRETLAAPLQSDVLVRTPHGREVFRGDQVQPEARLARGLYRLTAGRWPRTAEEVVVNQAVRDRGVGDTLTVVGRDGAEPTRRIVGTIRDATTRSAPVALGLPGAFPASPVDTATPAWLLDGPPITWAQVKRLNALGVVVTDRHLATHPGDYPDPFPTAGTDNTNLQVGALIVVMALIEVVLLAGPAFAVGARKQQRSLALLVASGGTPTQARRVILAGGLLLGLTGAVVGVVAGLLAARPLVPVVQRFSSAWLGPFDVAWLHVLAVAAFGLVSALLACVVPAWIASRHNVVAVLAGRRGDAAPVRAFPVLGVSLFLLGVLMAVWGARGHGTLTVAWSAVVCVLGMVLLVPLVVSWVARSAGSLPLPIRFAARDAVRHRTRTTPAVAAVAATVAGVVALGIGNASDEKQNRETYRPSLVMGNAAVMPSYDLVGSDGTRTDWGAVTAVIHRRDPQARIWPVVGVQQDPTSGAAYDISFSDPAHRSDDGDIWPASSRQVLDADIVVSDGRDLSPTLRATLPDRDRVVAALAAGRAVLFAGRPDQSRLDRAVVQADLTDDQGDVTSTRSTTVPALVIYASPDRETPVRALLPPALVRKAGLPAATVGLELDHPDLSPAAATNLGAALDDLATPASVTVERGYQRSAFATILQWVLAALAAILMLGGTLTAMFLALSDARPDLATLAAVGAEPRTRRRVAAAYTFVVAFVGAVLGLLVGFVPGLAIAWPLTAESWTGHPGPYVEVPWLMIAVVVIGLPVLTAVVVGLATRSRLPMVSRLT